MLLLWQSSSLPPYNTSTPNTVFTPPLLYHSHKHIKTITCNSKKYELGNKIDQKFIVSVDSYLNIKSSQKRSSIVGDALILWMVGSHIWGGGIYLFIYLERAWVGGRAN